MASNDYVLRTIEERRVRMVRLMFCDVLGQMKSVAISPVELETAFEEGVRFDGSAIDGFSRLQEADVLAIPDADSFELYHTEDPEDRSGIMFCDIIDLDGSPFEGDPRAVLRRNVERARASGFEFMCAPEVEFFYLANDSSPPQPLDNAQYFDYTTRDGTSGIRQETIRRLEAMSIPVEYSFHEDAPSQQEIDLRWADALTMADNLMALRMIVREVAAERGLHATFMPKPFEGVQGSGMHTHMSLFNADTNAFHPGTDSPDSRTNSDNSEASQTDQLSSVAKQFTAGLLNHAPEITAITNQLINSYKRLIPGFEAPSLISWAYNNRSALVRVPIAKPGKSESTRVEYRAIDPACNPYLAFSALLSAGLAGIEGQYELPAEAPYNMFELNETERADLGIQSLPRSLAEALDKMEASELVAEAIGDHIFEWFIRNKRAEWRDYKAHVSTFELDRYLSSW